MSLILKKIAQDYKLNDIKILHKNETYKLLIIMIVPCSI